MASERRLGIDIGRVIIGGSADPSAEDTSFFRGGLEDALRTPPIADVFEVLPTVVGRFDGRVWLISKCGPRVQARTLAWLDHHDFYGRCGISRTNVRFCLQRADKALHCRELAITDFIDDRLDVLQAVHGTVDRCYLFGPQAQPAPAWVMLAPNWTAMLNLVEVSAST